MAHDDGVCSAANCGKRAWHRDFCNYHAIMAFYHQEHATTAPDSAARSLVTTAELKRKQATNKNGIRRLDTVTVGTNTGRARATPRG